MPCLNIGNPIERARGSGGVDRDLTPARAPKRELSRHGTAVLNMKPEYRQVVAWEQKPDLYGGDGCDEVRPRWYGYADGDKEGGFDDRIEFLPELFPPGTLIKVLIPCCPECGQDVDLCRSDDGCEFDWDHWRDCQYS